MVRLRGAVRRRPAASRLRALNSSFARLPGPPTRLQLQSHPKGNGWAAHTEAHRQVHRQVHVSVVQGVCVDKFCRILMVPSSMPVAAWLSKSSFPHIMVLAQVHPHCS